MVLTNQFSIHIPQLIYQIELRSASRSPMTIYRLYSVHKSEQCRVGIKKKHIHDDALSRDTHLRLDDAIKCLVIKCLVSCTRLTREEALATFARP